LPFERPRATVNERGFEQSGEADQVSPQGQPAEHQAARAQPADAVDAPDGAQVDPRQTVSIVDRMAKTGIIHRNTAGRYKSRLASHVERASK
jgi:ribosomal protein S20